MQPILCMQGCHLVNTVKITKHQNNGSARLLHTKMGLKARQKLLPYGTDIMWTLRKETDGALNNVYSILGIGCSAGKGRNPVFKQMGISAENPLLKSIIGFEKLAGKLNFLIVTGTNWLKSAWWCIVIMYSLNYDARKIQGHGWKFFGNKTLSNPSTSIFCVQSGLVTGTISSSFVFCEQIAFVSECVDINYCP